MGVNADFQAEFLSCLSGSELAVAMFVTLLDFLSCLSGSDGVVTRRDMA